MSGYSEDLRRRIVSSVIGGMSKTQAARTFSVSLSSVKRYANKADRGEPLALRKSPGPAPKPDEKATKRLEEDLRERRDYVEAITRISGEPLHRLPRHSPRWHHQEKGAGSHPTRRIMSAAWRVMVARALEPERLLFVDERGTHTSLVPIYG